MRILIYGAGALGSLLAPALLQRDPACPFYG
jgi:ketopantoate reductase